MELTGTVDLARLTPPERLELISQLWDSLDAEHIPLTTAQRDELDRRIAAVENNEDEPIDWEVLNEEMRLARPL